MSHPSTKCDRALFLDKHGKPLPIAAEQITKLVTWYERSWVQINEALPVAVGGETYTQQWQDTFDRVTLPQWRSERLKHGLAVAYIYLALRRLYRGLEERAGP